MAHIHLSQHPVNSFQKATATLQLAGTNRTTLEVGSPQACNLDTGTSSEAKPKRVRSAGTAAPQDAKPSMACEEAANQKSCSPCASLSN